MHRTVPWLAVCAAVVCACLAAPASAALVNGGFETGDLSGWTISARDVTRYGIGGLGSPPLPAEGSFFALLNGDIAPWTELSQQVTLGVGDRIEGYAYFQWNLSEEDAYVRIYDSLDTLVDTPWLRNGEDSPAWESWAFAADAADTYRLVLGIQEPSVQTMHSQVYFDGNVFVDVPDIEPGPCGIPAPGAILLGAIGAGIVGRMRRRLA